MGSTVQRSCQIWADILRILCPLPGPMTWPYPEQQNKAQPSDEKEREREDLGTGSPARAAMVGISPACCSKRLETKSGPGCFLSQNSLMSEMVPLSLATRPFEGKIEL